MKWPLNGPEIRQDDLPIANRAVKAIIADRCVRRAVLEDAATGDTDTYVLGVRTQTGLRTEPANDALDPGYDFWMTFSKDHIFVRRNHASSHTNNPTKVPVSEFIESGWRLHPASGRPLETPAAVLAALVEAHPGRQGAIVDGAGHWVQYEAHAAINALLLDWLARDAR